MYTTIKEITDLGIKEKRISEEGLMTLRNEITLFMDRNDKDYLDIDVLEFVCNYIYNQAYAMAIQNTLEIIRRKE